MKCLELISSSGGKVHGKAVMTGVESMQECVSVGGVEYWMTMKLPITQTAKHYQVRKTLSDVRIFRGRHYQGYSSLVLDSVYIIIL